MRKCCVKKRRVGRCADLETSRGQREVEILIEDEPGYERFNE